MTFRKADGTDKIGEQFNSTTPCFLKMAHVGSIVCTSSHVPVKPPFVASPDGLGLVGVRVRDIMSTRDHVPEEDCYWDDEDKEDAFPLSGNWRRYGTGPLAARGERRNGHHQDEETGYCKGDNCPAFLESGLREVQSTKSLPITVAREDIINLANNDFGPAPLLIDPKILDDDNDNDNDVDKDRRDTPEILDHLLRIASKNGEDTHHTREEPLDIDDHHGPVECEYTECNEPIDVHGHPVEESGHPIDDELELVDNDHDKVRRDDNEAADNPFGGTGECWYHDEDGWYPRGCKKASKPDNFKLVEDEDKED